MHPDPLQFLYPYDSIYDREIVGLIASSLAYGRVQQILKSVSSILEMIPEPSKFLRDSSLKRLILLFSDFKHRFTTGEELAFMLYGVKRLIEEYSSLYALFLECINKDDDTVIPASLKFINELSIYANNKCGTLIPMAEGCSACKRINLYFRWMVRKDAVDPGGWDRVPASKLIVPLDTHLHRFSLKFGITQRKQANMKTAQEITAFFKQISPHDPVKYDFALTRFGIWKREPDFEQLLTNE